MTRIQQLTTDAGLEESYEALYVYAYQTLSTVGIHPYAQVLASYIDDRRGQALLLRVGPTSRLPTLQEVVMVTTLLLIANLTTTVYERRGVACPVATEVLHRFGMNSEQA